MTAFSELLFFVTLFVVLWEGKFNVTLILDLQNTYLLCMNVFFSLWQFKGVFLVGLCIVHLLFYVRNFSVINCRSAVSKMTVHYG